ncbi:MAG: SAM-dependent methyltransferase [Hyphomicrobium sp.]|nr:SAM-dependent methyltransferase [Hyphomicrobium sp.]
MNYDSEERRDTPLALKLKDRIRRVGPISVAEYMQACLQDPEHGYYVKRLVIGRDGDFITASEISQIFGELIGLWSAVVWQQMGLPPRINLVELGPGRGTLMRDALRAAGKVPRFIDALDVHLVESNEHLIRMQRRTLETVATKLRWHGSMRSLPEGPALLIANEFLDTTAVEQSVDGAERRVTLDERGRLVFEPASGVVTERQDHIALTTDLASRASDAPLAALFIDYGHTETAAGETLQALRGHAPEHPLCSPGEADLTVHVDFAAFAAAIPREALAVDGPITQAEFLGRLGIVERASRLMHANPAKAAEIEMSVARLMAPQGMGSRFKVIGIRSSHLPCLPGFE